MTSNVIIYVWHTTGLWFFLFIYIFICAYPQYHDMPYTVTVLIIRGDLCSRISRFKKKREIK